MGSTEHVGATALVVLLIAGWLVGCDNDRGFERDNVRVTDVELTELRSGARILTGNVENGSQKDISGLQIQISLFDGDNRRVDRMSVTIQNLEAGEVRAFREPIDSDFDVRGVRVRSLLFP